jgi:UBA/TS-N domain-containing protein
MERFIRDKYERQAFKRGSPSITPKAPGSEAQRFLPQLAQLAELGFKDSGQNIKVLKATHGNLQETVDILSVGKSEHDSSLFDPLSKESAAKTSVSDLVDISFDSTSPMSEEKTKKGMFAQSPLQRPRANVENDYDAFDSPW